MPENTNFKEENIQNMSVSEYIPEVIKKSYSSVTHKMYENPLITVAMIVLFSCCLLASFFYCSSKKYDRNY